MNSLLNDRKGGDKVISVYWFAVLVIIAGGVFGMAYSFYGAPYDVRNLEVDVLSNKIADCVSSQGRLNPELFNESDGNFSESFEDEFFDVCGLDFKAESEEGWDLEIQYFSEIKIYDLNENELFSVQNGNLNLRGDCFVFDEDNEDYETLAQCDEKRFYSVGPENDEQYLVSVLVSINKQEKNVKL